MRDLLISKLEAALPLHNQREERLALYRYALNITCSCALVGLLLWMPELDITFSWMKG
jgi:hypothetical protein